MPDVATWIRPKDEGWFRPIFDRYPGIRVHNAAHPNGFNAAADALLLTGGPDISKEFLHQEVPDESLLEKDADSSRDAWEFAATKDAIARGLPIFGICKGLQVLNVALGGTLKLDIRGHNLPELREHDAQPLRTERSAVHRLTSVNSSHHQAIDRLADGCEIEAWCATDDIIEQIRLRDYPFGLAVQYHPERGGIYDALFDDFFAHVRAGSLKPA